MSKATVQAVEAGARTRAYSLPKIADALDISYVNLRAGLEADTGRQNDRPPDEHWVRARSAREAEIAEAVLAQVREAQADRPSGSGADGQDSAAG